MTELLLPLPDSASAFRDIEWPEVATWYDRLDQLPTTDPSAWFHTWSRFESLLHEAASRAMIAYTCATDDTKAAKAHRRFSTEIGPQAVERATALARRAVTVGLDYPDMVFPLRRFQAAIDVFREANVPLVSEVESLSTEYQRVTGGMMATWEGKPIPLPQLGPFLVDTDRRVRERAWHAGVAPYLDARDSLNDLFDQMRTRRQAMAANADFASYRDMVFRAKARFDYSPEDCLQFHRAVAQAVVPVLRRLRRIRRERLGVSQLRPWDLSVNPYRENPLRPYTDPKDLARVAGRIFARLDPHLGRQFAIMQQEKLLDLESRKGKAPGGYCDTLPIVGRPFIFMNAAGIMADVMTLLHESGHAFHAFAAASLPLVWQRQPGAEAAELASMGMELLAGQHLGPPVGYLSEADAAVAMLDYVEDAVHVLAHIAAVDAFQHWVYTDPLGAEPDARDEQWRTIRAQFDPDVDWSGLEDVQATRWHRQLHIFIYPFYYIEYGFAQLGAFQLWRNSIHDPQQTLTQYRTFLGLGARRSLPELYCAAGVRFAFDGETISGIMAFVEHQTTTWRAQIGTL